MKEVPQTSAAPLSDSLGLLKLEKPVDLSVVIAGSLGNARHAPRVAETV
jgi:hypothetical protein